MAVNRVFHFYFFPFILIGLFAHFFHFLILILFMYFFLILLFFIFFPVVVNGRVVCGVGAVRRPAPVTPSNEPPDNWIYM